MPITGYKELSEQLAAMGKAAGGKILRSAAMSAMVPAMRDAKAHAPVADPPYQYGNRTFDPYPKLTILGRRVAPGFASRSVARKSVLSSDGTHVTVMLGVKSEAFYAVQFIELGTRFIAKRPWLEPSFHAITWVVDAELQRLLKKKIDQAAATGREPLPDSNQTSD